MKIRPVILCGGAGTRLWPNQKNHQAKQFIDFGGWSLIQKTLERIKNPIFDYPVISTNFKYLSYVRKSLKKSKIKKYKIVLEPAKKNTAPAILSSALIKEIPSTESRRVIKIPQEIMSKDVKSSYKDGILKVTLPISDPEPRQQIPVN